MFQDIYNDIIQWDRGSKYSAGTNSKKYIVLHHTWHANDNTTFTNMCNYLWTNASAYVSCHYVVSNWQDQKIAQLYDQDRITRHAWLSQRQWLTNLNSHSIGIEVFSRWTEYDDWQRDATRDLVLMLMEDNNIWAENVIRHKDISWYRGKRDIGDNFWNNEYPSYAAYQAELDRLINQEELPEWITEPQKIALKNIVEYSDLLRPKHSALYDAIEDEQLRSLLHNVNKAERELNEYINTIV